MKKKLLLRVLTLFIFSSTTVFAQIPDSCTFVQNDSIITIEMESANLNGGFWTKQTDLPGYLGSGFIQYVGGSSTGVPGRNQLTYTFRVKEAGRHSFKMRAYRDDYEDNDVWVRFPHGGVVTKIGDDSTGTMEDNWFKAVIGARDMWYGFVKTQHLGTSWGETFHDIYVDFPAPGVYTVEFSGRAAGFRIDRFMLYYEKSSFHGMNPENQESARENCSPYEMGDAPYVANPIPDQTVNGETTWNYTFPENTFGGSSLDYAAYQGASSPLPSWMTFNSVTRTFTGSPTYNDGGEYTILVKAVDNGKHAVDAFVLTVAGNTPPEMTVALQDTIANTGQSFTYDIDGNFSDADGHSLTYAVTSHEGESLPFWLSFNGTTFMGNPSNDHLGNDTIYVTVNDGNGGSLTESFIIHIMEETVQSVNKGIRNIKANVYPNPVNDILNIQMEEPGTGTLTLADNTGKIHYRKGDLSLQNNITVDLSSLDLQPGLFLLRVKSDVSGAEFHSLVIKK